LYIYDTLFCTLFYLIQLDESNMSELIVGTTDVDSTENATAAD
jgi:hypothetical protein